MIVGYALGKGFGIERRGRGGDKYKRKVRRWKKGDPKKRKRINRRRRGRLAVGGEEFREGNEGERRGGQRSTIVKSFSDTVARVLDQLRFLRGVLFWYLEEEDEMTAPRKLSGMQKQVLALYREFLRAARLKDVEERQRIVAVVSAEFRRNAEEVDRKNFQHIEYLLRRGKRQLEQLHCSSTITISTVKLNS
ncbi:hypothetical protein HPP92_016746 [Vanilla planifolia]|uniref:Complex 1 LYR protein domain-containing protein n=1 Tax=Vanilla planifolia TaxID=51239 RepID=A0A835QKR0_VANPL|nr:hypothetical protein HPP92_016746 [Vanilla planifolia]